MTDRAGPITAVAVALLPGMPLFEVAVPCEVFGAPRPGLVDPPYAVWLCAAGGGVDLGLGTLAVEHDWEDLAQADVVVVPALAAWDDPVPDALVTALQDAHRRGAQVVGLCTGAFVVGAAGLLDGREATTHWMYTRELAERHPRARVDEDVLWAGDEDVLTSAGTASGLDLCLEIVRRDRGAAVANDVARRMVTAPRRTGGQAQFVAWSTPPDAGAGLASCLDWALEHLGDEIGPADLARAAHVSVRTLSRRFHDELGASPAEWLLDQRVRRCQELLETTTFPVGQVSAMAGFASTSTMRAHFVRVVGTSPSDYRRTFGADGT